MEFVGASLKAVGDEVHQTWPNLKSQFLTKEGNG